MRVAYIGSVSSDFLYILPLALKDLSTHSSLENFYKFHHYMAVCRELYKFNLTFFLVFCILYIAREWRDLCPQCRRQTSGVYG